MIGDAQLRTLGREGHPIILVGEDRRQLLGLARAIHQNSDFASGPFLIHRCGGRSAPDPLGNDLIRFCAGLFRKADGGTIYFEKVDNLSPEENKQLYMVLERGEYWDPELEDFAPARFRILSSAPQGVLEPARATKLTYRLAERIIILASGSSE